MPESVDECVDSVMSDNPDYSESRAYAICWSQQNEGDLKEANEDFSCAFSDEVKDLSKDEDALTDEEAASVVAASKLAETDDDRAVKAVAYRSFTGQWGGVHPAEKTNEGREHLLTTYKSAVDSLVQEWDDALKKVDGEDEDTQNTTTEKSDSDYPVVKFKMQSSTGILPVFKSKDGDMVIWGPASVEVVDKEGDKIRASALEEALPQLLRRQRLSLEHSDQLVGEILENFETDEPITVDIDGKTLERNEFPTGVLELDDMKPSLFVAGKIWDDTRQSRQTQKDIENGDLDSYSISGESLVATTKYEEGDVVNDIKELDLSAVTLCEEGMNQGAKFGVVSKADGDARADEGDNVENSQAAVSKGARGPAGVHAHDTIHIVKNMGDNESTSDGVSNPSEAVSLDDVREEFKNVVNESLPDAELATKDDTVSKEDVESIVDEKSMDKDEVRSIARKTAEEVYEDEEPEDDEEKGDDEMPPEDEEAEDDEEFEEEPEPVEAEDDEEFEEEPEVDDEVAPEEEPEVDDESPPEEEDEEEMKGYDHSDLEEMLPEDLYEAVREYLDEDDGAEEMGGEDEEMMEMSGSGEEGLTEDEVEKMIQEQFGDEMALDSPSGPTAEVQKSWEQEDDPATDDQVGPAAQQLYDL
jgi:hypothetical protein